MISRRSLIPDHLAVAQLCAAVGGNELGGGRVSFVYTTTEGRRGSLCHASAHAEAVAATVLGLGSQTDIFLELRALQATGRQPGSVWALAVRCRTERSRHDLEGFTPGLSLVLADPPGHVAIWALPEGLTPEQAADATQHLADVLGGEAITDSVRPPGCFNHTLSSPTRVECLLLVPRSTSLGELLPAARRAA